MPKGVKKQRSENIRAWAARDVAAGTSWAFRDHRTMKEVMADECPRRGDATHAARVARRMVEMLRS
jgi:hypothetical protein